MHLEERTHLGSASTYLGDYREEPNEENEAEGDEDGFRVEKKAGAGSIISYGDKENYPENSPNRLSGGGPTAPSYHSP